MKVILAIRTDKPEAEIYIYDGQKQIDFYTWVAHRQLAETLHAKIRDLLHGYGKDWSQVAGLVFYKGPGSFTGLRIGAATVNALSVGGGIALVGSTGPDWIQQGIEKLDQGRTEIVVPDYGGDPHVTRPKK